MQLVILLDGIAFGDEDEAVTRGELGEGGVDGGEKFDFLLGDGLGEAYDTLVLLGCDGGVGELLETIDERATETVETVTICGDGGMLAVVEVLADLLWRVNAMVEVGNERDDGALEVDVVFPEGIVCVDEQGLACVAVD